MWQYVWSSCHVGPKNVYNISTKRARYRLHPKICFRTPRVKHNISEHVSLTVLLLFLLLGCCFGAGSSSSAGWWSLFPCDRALLPDSKDICVHVQVCDMISFSFFLHVHDYLTSWKEEEQMLEVKWGPQVTSCDRRCTFGTAPPGLIFSIPRAILFLWALYVPISASIIVFLECLTPGFTSENTHPSCHTQQLMPWSIRRFYDVQRPLMDKAQTIVLPF